MNKVFKGKVLRIPVGVQQRYTETITKLVDRMTKETTNAVVKLFSTDHAREHFATDASDAFDRQLFDTVGTTDATTASQTRILINSLKRRWDVLFSNLSFGLSPMMADSLNRASAVDVKGSLKGAPNLWDEGKKISIDVRKLDERTLNIFKTASNASADFIKSIPERYLNTVADNVYKSITSGNGLADLVPFFEKQNNSTKNWAHNTAMDQTRKVYNGLNRGRMRSIGIPRAEWIHSGGSTHPRELHEDFDGKEYDLAVGAPVGDDGGNNVQAGEEPNCRCTFRPVIDFSKHLQPDDD